MIAAVTKAFAALACALLCAGTPTVATAQPAQSFEVFAGYSYLRDPSTSVLQATATDDSLGLGWVAGVAKPVLPWLAGVAEGGGHYKTKTTFDGDVTLSFHSIMGGARVSAAVGPLVEFGQVLLGVVHARGTAFGATASSTGFAIQPGGGLEYPVGRRLAARVELDYRRIAGSAEGRLRAHQFRAVAAIAYRP